MKLHKDEIISAACISLGIAEIDLLSRTKKGPVADCRIIVAYHLYDHCNKKLVEIGQILGRGHSNVIYLTRQYNSLIKTNKAFREKAQKVMESFEAVKCRYFNSIPQY